MFRLPSSPRRRVVARFALGFALASAIALIGCRERSEAGSHSAPALDDFGDTLAVAAAPPTRIVSLNPTSTELLYAIGAGPRLVGRTTYDILPAQVRSLPDLGPGLRPNIEAVLGVRPDLVILYASEDNRDAARRFRAAGVRVASYRIDRLSDFRRVTRALGLLTGDTAAARVTIDTVTATLDRVRRANAGATHPTIFWPLWESPLLTVGGGSYLNELLEVAGGRNVYADLPQPSPTVTMEDLVRRDPDLILTSAETRQRMRTQPRWQVLRAVRQGNIRVFDSTIVNGPSARIGANAEALAALLHAPQAPE